MLSTKMIIAKRVSKTNISLIFYTRINMNALGYALLFIALFLLIDKKSATRINSYLLKMTGSDDKMKKNHSSYPIKYPKNTLTANYYPVDLRFNDGDEFGYCT